MSYQGLKNQANGIAGLNSSGQVPIAQGGTGQATQQTAINALAGSTTSGQYLRGTGTNVTMSAIQAADVPTLNQNTTGNAATATLATTATNVAGGVAGAVPYQSATGATNFSAAGTSGQVLTSTGTTAPNWTTVSATPTANNIAKWDANVNMNANNLIPALTSIATAAGTTTLTAASIYEQYFTGSTTQTVVLPVATTLTNGFQFLITNASTGVVSVQTSNLSTFFNMQANTQLLCTCINTAGGTTTASWDYVYRGIKSNYLTALLPPQSSFSLTNLGYLTTNGGATYFSSPNSFTATAASAVALGQVLSISSSGVAPIAGTDQSLTSFGAPASIATSYTTQSTTLAGGIILAITTGFATNAIGYQAYTYNAGVFTSVTSGSTTITAASSVTAESVSNSAIYGSSSNNYAVFAMQDVYLQAVKISGGSMTIGAYATCSTGYGAQRIVEVGTDKFVVFTTNFGNPGSIYGQIFTVNATTMAITLVGSNQLVFSNVTPSGLWNISACPTGNASTQPGGFGIVYINSSGFLTVASGVVSGSTITAGNTAASPTSSASNINFGQQLTFASTQLAIWTYIQTGGTAYTQLVWFNGSTATPQFSGSYLQVGATNTWATIVGARSYTIFNALVMLQPSSSLTTYTGFIVNSQYSGVTSVQSSGITLTTSLGSTGLYTCSVTPSLYTTTATGGIPIVVWCTNATTPTLTFSYTVSAANSINYAGAFGISDSTVGSGNTVNVTMLNQIDNAAYTGLTIGSIYYIQPNGYLGTTSSSYPFGRAISATQLLLTRNP